MNRARLIPTLLATALIGSGCTTLGGNVKGEFTCRAPSGSCASMSAIDDRAVASVAGELATEGALAPVVRRLNSTGGGSLPARSSERTLTVIFPAHVDAAGVLHDEARAHIVVEGPAWTFAPTNPAPDTPEFSRSPALPRCARQSPELRRRRSRGSSRSPLEPLTPSTASTRRPLSRRQAGNTRSARQGARRTSHRQARRSDYASGTSRRPPFGESWSLPRGKVVFPSEGDPATVARKVRELAGPTLDRSSKAGSKSGEEIVDPFRAASPTEPRP